MAETHAIAVVDDDANLLEIFSATLSSSDWKIFCSPNAEIAKAHILQRHFSALLTDALPEYESVISAFKTENPQAPAIVLTGRLLPELEKQARPGGIGRRSYESN